MAQLLGDRDVHCMAVACGAWRDALDPGTRAMSFAWAATGHAAPDVRPPTPHPCRQRACHVVFATFASSLSTPVAHEACAAFYMRWSMLLLL